MKLKQTWRWFGPDDPVSLSDILQAGATGVVSALHHIANGEIWPVDQILQRKKQIESAGLEWVVVESVPVHEDIKKRKGHYQKYIENYKQTLSNLAACDIETVCYNFMPVLDWTRTDLAYPLPNGAFALRFDTLHFSIFENLILKRKNNLTQNQMIELMAVLEQMTDNERNLLIKNIIAGLPGAEEGYTLQQFQKVIDEYSEIGNNELRNHLLLFLNEVVPTAEKVGVKLAIHPDDPPFPILGLPRVVSTREDLAAIVKAYHSPYNGICFCTGSLGVRPDNDLIEMVKEFSPHINFVHLRSTKREENGSFHEANHLEGDVDMPAIMKQLILENQKRKEPIPFRPDHGHQMLDDKTKKVNPGYSAIGRLKGLAELRGLELGITSMINNQNV